LSEATGRKDGQGKARKRGPNHLMCGYIAIKHTKTPVARKPLSQTTIHKLNADKTNEVFDKMALFKAHL